MPVILATSTCCWGTGAGQPRQLDWSGKGRQASSLLLIMVGWDLFPSNPIFRPNSAHNFSSNQEAGLHCNTCISFRQRVACNLQKCCRLQISRKKRGVIAPSWSLTRACYMLLLLLICIRLMLMYLWTEGMRHSNHCWAHHQNCKVHVFYPGRPLSCCFPTNISTCVRYNLCIPCTFPIGGFLLLTYLTPRFFCRFTTLDAKRKEVRGCQRITPVRRYPAALRQQHSAPWNSLHVWAWLDGA